MSIYLVQHGIAKSKEESRERELTEVGRAEVTRMAKWIAKKNIKVSKIIHSEKLRAKQTAHVFEDMLACPSKEMKGLSPTDDPREIQKGLEEMDNVLIVGHLPYLQRLTSLLVLNDINSEILSFKNSGIVCLKKIDKEWILDWVMIPEIL